MIRNCLCLLFLFIFYEVYSLVFSNLVMSYPFSFMCLFFLFTNLAIVKFQPDSDKNICVFLHVFKLCEGFTRVTVLLSEFSIKIDSSIL